MKKALSLILVAGTITLFSCKDGKEGDKGTEAKTDSTATTSTKTEENGTTPTSSETTTTTTSSEAPTFNDADVTAFVKAYDEYIAAYKDAVEKKDMTKIADLGKTGQDLATKATAATQKLASNPEDAKKLTDYMTAKSTELAELSKKLSGQ